MKKISQLDPAQPLTGAELVEVVQNGGNYRTTVSNFKGNDGLSAYELAQQAGFEGSFEDWLVSINGRDGTQWFVLDEPPNSGIGKLNDYAIDRTTGRYYLKHVTGIWIEQGILFPANGMEDAPNDSKLYGRKDKSWQELSKPVLYDAMGFVKDDSSGIWLMDNGKLSD